MKKPTLLCRLLVLLVLAAPSSAWAHAALLSSTPQAGSILATAPPELALQFNEPVAPLVFKVVDSQGHSAGDPGGIVADGATLHLPLHQTLPDGTYILTYRVVSVDTHPVAGSFMFSVGAGHVPLTYSQTAESRVWAFAVATDRFALYGFTLLAAGAALFLLLLDPVFGVAEACAESGRAGTLLAGIAYVLAVGLGGADMLNGPAAVLLSSESWRTGATSSLGQSAVLGVSGCFLLFIAFRLRQRWLLILGVALSLGGFLVTGHAATAEPVAFSAVLVGVHILCAAFWLGALYPLLFAARHAPVETTARLVTQFSNYAVAAVTAVALTGLAIGIVQVQRPAGLIDNTYGIRLLVKVALFVVLAAIAMFNKRSLTPLIQRGETWAAARLGQMIRVEIGLFVLILAAAATLTMTPPPRIAASAPAAGTGIVKQSVRAGSVVADVEVTPAKPGANMFMVTFKDDRGAPLKLSAVKMTLDLPSAGISHVEKDGAPIGLSAWHFMVPETAVAGEWQVHLEAFTDPFDKTDLSLTVPIR